MSALATIINRFAPVAGSRRIGPIGLECALHALHMVQLEAGRDGRVGVRARASLSYPCPLEELLDAPDQLKLLIKRALREHDFSGREVVTTLPSPDLQIMPVTYHVAQDESPEAALVAVISERLDGEFSDYVVDYTPVRTEARGGEQLAIVAVAKRDAVINYLEALRTCGLHTEHLEVGPTAIRRLISALGDRTQHENVMAINFGRHSSYITVISGARLLFDQAIQFGETGLLVRIASELEMSEPAVTELVQQHSLLPNASQDSEREREIAETLVQIVKPEFLRLVEEINRTLIYTASQTHGKQISRIYILGSLARWRGTDALLRSLVKLDVKTIPNPLKPFFTPGRRAADDTGEPAPEIAVATGLALNGMMDDDGD
ncbi:MAG: pilus assembly protein PilM [Gammaproteobacteria bacterium]|nr:pilus assembly protein PilM [Gammaproteobacteria bacterium]